MANAERELTLAERRRKFNRVVGESEAQIRLATEAASKAFESATADAKAEYEKAIAEFKKKYTNDIAPFLKQREQAIAEATANHKVRTQAAAKEAGFIE
jgi:hypothetical protein